MKSNLYTRGGDRGTTSLVGGQRIAKDDPRLEAYGTVDELNSWLGRVAVGFDTLDEHCRRQLETTFRAMQSRLFDIGGHLATDPAGPYAEQMANPVSQTDIAALEAAIDQLDSQLPRLTSFVLPGGNPSAADAHIARTVCRRAERRVVSLAAVTEVDPLALAYLNRISDLLFALARFFVIKNSDDEIFWTKNC